MPATITNKAVTYSGQGDYDVIAVTPRALRLPATGEVCIRIVAAAVNPTDILLRENFPGDVPLPLTPGMDAAGIIEAIGPDVDRLSVGD